MAAALDDLPDETLMRRYQGGEEAAFALLMRRHLPGVYNFAARHVGSTGVAEDIAQDAFVRVVERAAEFKHEARFSTWLYAITRNLCIDHLRKMSHRRHPSLDDGGADDAPPLRDRLPDDSPGASAERMAMSGEIGARIAEGLERLPEAQREVFLLREVAELPFPEIAVLTGTSENTVKSRMRYALERLQGWLEDLVSGDADEAESAAKKKS